jgi:hypothetical protein
MKPSMLLLGIMHTAAFSSIAFNSRIKRAYSWPLECKNDGQFALLDGSGRYFTPDHIFGQTDPLSYIRDTLSYGDDHTINHEAPGNAKETVVFCGGNDEGVVKYVSKVLDGLPMAHVQAGQGESMVDYQSLSGNMSFQSTISKLLDVAVASSDAQPHLVLVCYSTATEQVAAAIHMWFEHQTTITDSQLLLQKRVTVVTLAATCQNFPDGPAYLHVFMDDDPYALCSSGKLAEKGAVYLHAYSPYYYADSTPDMKLDSRRDAHNLRACLIQWLSIILRVNGLRSFRSLYNVITNDMLDNPPNLEDEVLPATIRATGGHTYLCRLGEDVIPGEDEASIILEWQYGYGAYEEIAEAMRET